MTYAVVIGGADVMFALVLDAKLPRRDFTRL